MRRRMVLHSLLAVIAAAVLTAACERGANKDPAAVQFVDGRKDP